MNNFNLFHFAFDERNGYIALSALAVSDFGFIIIIITHPFAPADTHILLHTMSPTLYPFITAVATTISLDHGFSVTKEAATGMHAISNTGIVHVPRTNEELLSTLDTLAEKHTKRLQNAGLA